jgi:hypothetical protein
MEFSRIILNYENPDPHGPGESRGRVAKCVGDDTGAAVPINKRHVYSYPI